VDQIAHKVLEGVVGRVLGRFARARQFPLVRPYSRYQAFPGLVMRWRLRTASTAAAPDCRRATPANAWLGVAVFQVVEEAVSPIVGRTSGLVQDP
jgi:hypothetical protein